MRALIAIGCNAYDQFDKLPLLDGAELDAERVFNGLIRDEVGGYDPELSALLLSPKEAECRDAISLALGVQGGLDVLTVYFAGHGVVDRGSFYLCPRDAVVEKLWQTALPLSHIFGMVAGAQPKHVNVIIDACFSGALVSDLGSLTRSEVLGWAGSTSVTLLAMSSSDQPSLEDCSGGFGTSALIRCISGETFVQRSSSSLELTEIAPVLCEEVSSLSGQEPVWYALNHRLKSPFCRNSHFQSDPASTFERWSPRGHLDSLQPILMSHSSVPRELIADVERLSSGLLERAENSTDAIRPIEVRSASIVALLEYASTSQEIRRHLVGALGALSETIRSTLICLVRELEEDDLVLARSGAGLADLYYLPIRITRLLGWLAAGYHIDVALGRDGSFPSASLEQLVNTLASKYAGSVGVMSDSQAPDILVTLTALKALGLADAAEMLFGLLFNSVCQVQGNIADAHIKPEDVLRYVICRGAGDFDELELLARPTEVVPVLLRCADLLSLSDEVDFDLDRMDHLPLNAYVPDDYTLFARRRMHGGHNLSFIVGHDVWRVEDLQLHWPSDLPLPADSVVACCCLVASLLFPDRVPWFLLPHCAPFAEEEEQTGRRLR